MNFQKLFTLINTAISLVEEIYPPKTGSTKLGAVLAITQAAATVLAQSGQIPLGAAHDTLGMTEYVQSVFDKSTYSRKASTPVLPTTPVVQTSVRQFSPSDLQAQAPNISDAVRLALARAQPKKGE